MLLVDLGGAKGASHVPADVQRAWKTLDVRDSADYICNLNTCERLPFEDDTIDHYYTSMTLEHFYPGRLKFILAEMFRTLQREGKIRICVPDITKGIEWYLHDHKSLNSGDNPSCPHPDDYPPTPLGKLIVWFVTEDSNQKSGIVTNGHKMAFDFDVLKWYLELAGFREIAQVSYGVGSKVFNGKDVPRYQNFGLYVEAKK
jgi:predicted SAM-dependent methyltransferase